MRKWNRQIAKYWRSHGELSGSHSDRVLGCVNPFQEITLEETKEVREVISDGLNHFWDVGILITCQEKGSGSSLGSYGE